MAEAEEFMGLRMKDLFVLYAMSSHGRAMTPARITKAFRKIKGIWIGQWRVRRALKRLLARELVRPVDVEGENAYEVTETGRDLARQWAVAFEFAAFEPDP
jgi:repressor of nif and glnA expression